MDTFKLMQECDKQDTNNKSIKKWARVTEKHLKEHPEY